MSTHRAIVACPDCGVVSSEDYGSLGLCWDCYESRPAQPPVAKPTLRLYHQDEDQDQDQDQHFPLREAVPGPGGNAVAPGPGGNGGEMSGLDVLTELEARCRSGKLEPVLVELGPLPDSAGPVMRAIAEDIRWLIGVRLAVGRPLELPYAASMAVARGIASDKGTASKALRALVELDVVRHVGVLPPQRPGLDGTKLYAPPPCPSGPGAGED